MGEVTVTEFNGLGQRVNSMAVEHATCRGETRQRLESVEERQAEHRGEIKELFTAVDKVRTGQAALNGRMVGMGVVLSILIPIATALLMRVLS